MSEWRFARGTRVKATRYEDAVNKMYHCDFTHHWAMEEEPCKWTVLFGSDIEVEVHNASDSFDAARRAILQVRSEKELVEVRPSLRKLVDTQQRMCCFLKRMCDPD
jgi:hypothetical protein